MLCMICGAASLALVARAFFASTTRMRHLFRLYNNMTFVQQQSNSQPQFTEYDKIVSLPFPAATSETSTVFAPGCLDLGKVETIARCWTASPRSQDPISMLRTTPRIFSNRVFEFPYISSYQDRGSQRNKPSFEQELHSNFNMCLKLLFKITTENISLIVN